MNVQQIFDLAIKLGIENDFRSKSQIEKNLKRIKEKYQKLTKKEEKETFDKELLNNPYSDSRIHFSEDKKSVKKVIAGIDIDTSELMLAKDLKADLVIGHHPVGKGLSTLDGVMELQADVLAQYGIPINIAEGLLKKRIEEVSRGINPINHFKSPMAAELMRMNFINIHTPADNMVAAFLKKTMEREKPEYLEDILNVLLNVPEYKEAAKQGIGPVIFSGNENSRVGKIAITEITGGTEGSPKIYEKMANAGVGTVIAMHQSEDHRKEAQKAHINVIVAGHISSDSIGMNLFLDELEKKGIEVVPCSGLIRYSRVNSKF